MTDWRLAERMLASSFLIVFLSGCVSFKGNNIPAVTEDQLRSTKSSMFMPAVAVRFQMMIEKNGSSTEINKIMTADDRHAFVNLLEKTHLARHVDAETKADYIIDAVVKNNANSHSELWYWSSALSMGLIPYWGTNYLTLEVSIKDRMGKVMRFYIVQDQYSYWVQMFLLPISPFFWPDTVQAEVRENMYREFTKRLVADGLSFSL